MATSIKDIVRIEVLEDAVAELKQNVAALRQELDEAKAELQRRRGGRPRKDENDGFRRIEGRA